MTPLRPPRWLYFVLFTVSGFAGLIYESIWSHYLKLFLGHAAYAQSLVLMIFMGGLALGSWLTARRAERWRLPILGYAAVEAVIGLLALVFHPAFLAVTEGFYDSVLPGLGNPALGAALKWVTASLLMMPQSILLGMTFPLLTGGVIRRYPDNPGGTLSLLYFTNSIGAAAGVLASGFWFIGELGLPGTMRLAGLFNLGLAGVVALLVGLDRERGRVTPYAGVQVATPEARRAGLLFLAAAFITGAASFIYEVAWLRMLSLVLGSTTHSFELMLSAFIAGLAFGGLYIRRHIDRVANPLAFAAWVQVAMGVVAALSLPVYGQSFGWMAAILEATSRTDAGYIAFTLASHGIALAVMLPTTFLAGMTLPLFTHVMMKGGAGESAIGRVYAANTLGAIAGVLFAMHLGMPLLGVENLVGVGALLDIGLGVALLAWLARAGSPGRQSGRVPLVTAAGALATLAVVLVATDLRPGLLASGVYRYGREGLDQVTEVLFYRDGKTASIAVSAASDTFRSIITNGKPDASIQADLRQPSTGDEITMVMAGSLPFAYKADIRRVANIGLGSGLTTHTLLAVPDLEAVDTIEIETAMVEGARLFGPSVARAFEDPRSVIHIEDAKAFFPLHGGRYDVIVAEPSNPWVSGVASLFSTEFYGLVQDYLEEDGLMVQWLQFYEFNDDLYLSILKALAANFSDFAIYNNQDFDGIIVARKTGRLGAPDYGRLLNGPLGPGLARVRLREPADLALRRVADRGMVEPLFAASPAPANSDFAPYVDLNAGAARFREDRARLFRDWAEAPLPVVEMLGSGQAGLDGPLSSDTLLGRVRLVLAARAVRDRFLDGTPLPRGIPEGLAAAVEATVLGAGRCPAGASEGAWLRHLHPVMEATLAFLSPGEGTALVAGLLPPDCGEGLGAMPRAWLDLYAAVARRDSGAITGPAVTLLGNRPHRDNLEGARQAYLFGAVLLAGLDQGRPGAGRSAWQLLQGNNLYRGYDPPLYLDALVDLSGITVSPQQTPTS